MVSQSVIARQLKLSQRTVSLCLAGSDRVADRTRQRVLEVAADLGYRPNRSALAMRTGRFNALALIRSTRDGVSYLPEGCLGAIQAGLMKRGMHLVLADIPDEKLTDSHFLPSVLREWSVDGFIVNYHYGFSPKMVDVIETNRLPSVWLNTKREFDCVYPDDVEGGDTLTRHLLEAGHRNIAFFSQRRFGDHFSVGDRYDGYERAMNRAGLQPRKLFFDDTTYFRDEESLRYVRSFLDAPDRPTAIITYESFEAIRVMLVAFGLGIRIPQELSLATFHEKDFRDGGFRVTTIHIPHAEMGKNALDMLLRRIEGDGPHVPGCPVKFQTITGASVAPPKHLRV